MATKTTKSTVLKKTSTSAIASALLGSGAGTTPNSISGSMAGEAARNGSASTIKTPLPGYVSTSSAPVGSIQNVQSVDPFSVAGIQAAAAKLPGYTPVTANLNTYAPSKTAAQRAQDLVNAQYNAKMSGINSQVGTLDQNLAVGQATQDKYAVAGDTKLAQIYADLGQTTQGIANNIQSIYGDANKSVAGAYDQAGNTLQGVSDTAQKMLAAQGNQLGIGQAIPGASAQLGEYVGQQQSQMASDRANSVANATTLGANMSAAALKDVANTARYGADNRRDLVMQVQATKAKLQYDHDTAKKELLDQLSALESEKADALAVATSDNERYDAEQAYKQQVDQANLDFQNKSMQLQTDKQNLDNTLATLNAQDSHNQNVVGNQLAQGAQDIQKAQLQDTLTNNAFNREITAKQLGISLAELDLKIKQQGIDTQQQEFSQWLQKQNLSVNWSQLDLQQKQQLIDKAQKDTSLSLDARQISMQEANNIMDSVNAQNTNKVAAQKVAVQNAAALAKVTPGTPEYNMEQAKLAKIKADTDLTNKRIASLSGSTAKYGSVTDFYTANKLGPAFKNTVSSVLAVALRAGNGITKLDPVVAAQTLIYSGLDNFLGSNAYGVTDSDLTDQERKDLQALSGKDQGKLMQAVLLSLGKK